jgi:hypothetical protein
MAKVRGRTAVKQYLASLPQQMEGVLRGAGRAGAAVVADEIKLLTPSSEVRENLRIRSQSGDGRIVVRIDVKPGWARSLGIWLEWGTAPHFISVDDSQRLGLSVNKINKRVKDEGGAASLLIGGKFVGTTVFHPGSQEHPAFRPALDAKGADAVRAAQGYINSRIVGGRIAGSVEPEDEA